MSFSFALGRQAQALPPSPIRRFFDLVEQNKDAISLGIGEPDFVTPYPIRDEGIFTLEKGYTKYTPNAGLTLLRQEVSAYMARHFGLTYDYANEILITVGGSEAIDLGLRALLNTGDEVLIPEPSFVCYAPLTQLAGGVPVGIETIAAENFRLTADRLKAAITPRTKVLVLPFPCNPTGAIMEHADLEAIAQVLCGTDIVVLSDELYAGLTYGVSHISIATVDNMRERTLVVNGLSKSHAMTGWRMGFACAPPPLIAQMTRIHQYAIMSAPTMSQYAAIIALRDSDDSVEQMRQAYDQRRRLVLNAFETMNLPCFEPQGAFYAFPDIRGTGLSSFAFCERLLTKYKVAVIPGDGFGGCGEGFVRICYAVDVGLLTEALRRIEAFIKGL
ncbi:MAG: aminotransferase class I/II-fold pyridoxal phosphate-dependent enzyme [Oscillospiraceae bacterium]|nr:aminotransferase class I/II-fold pyridoxal phosphate-dependent enzyme [Oscillospiraceae bacterium]